MSHLVNNPDRVGDVTAEPFTAPPPDPEKCPSAVTANFAVSFSIDAARGGCMRMQTAAQSADPTEETSGHPWLINKKPPRIASGGNGKPFFVGMPGQGGWADRSRHPNRRLWSYGLRRRIDPMPANGGLEEDRDALS